MTAPISRFMTICPHTIGASQTLAAAHRFMREHQIRHLPVLEGSELVGVVSQRDLYFIETLKGVDPELVTVEEAMSQAPFVIDPDASVARVVREMAKQKYGCAVVADKGEVIGVFTTTDALRVLDALLTERGRAPSRGRTTAQGRRRARS
jgi:acetoin utilization protein AcuB